MVDLRGLKRLRQIGYDKQLHNLWNLHANDSQSVQIECLLLLIDCRWNCKPICDIPRHKCASFVVAITLVHARMHKHCGWDRRGREGEEKKNPLVNSLQAPSPQPALYFIILQWLREHWNRTGVSVQIIPTPACPYAMAAAGLDNSHRSSHAPLMQVISVSAPPCGCHSSYSFETRSWSQSAPCPADVQHPWSKQDPTAKQVIKSRRIKHTPIQSANVTSWWGTSLGIKDETHLDKRLSFCGSDISATAYISPQTSRGALFH